MALAALTLHLAPVFSEGTSEEIPFLSESGLQFVYMQEMKTGEMVSDQMYSAPTGGRDRKPKRNFLRSTSQYPATSALLA
jgi:hypothetical protein